MDELAKNFEAMHLHTFQLRSSYWVDVTCINNPHNFYVRPTDYRRYLNMLPKDSVKVHVSELFVGTMVIFESKKAKRYIRGEITNICQKKVVCDIYAIDYGFSEYCVHLRGLKKPNEYITTIPPLAAQCELADCMPKGETFSQEAIAAMKHFVGQERAKIYIRDFLNNKMRVVLVNSCPDDICTLMALTDYIKLSYHVPETIAPYLEEGFYYKHREFKVGDVLNVRCQSGKSLEAFYVATEHDHNNYLKQRPDLTDYCKKRRALGEHEVQPGAAVGVYMNRWMVYERATIKEFTEPNSQARVQLMDKGCEINVSLAKMKAIKAGIFYENPVCAIYCKAVEQQQHDPKIQKVLCPGFQFQIQIKTLGDKLNSPHIVHIEC